MSACNGPQSQVARRIEESILAVMLLEVQNTAILHASNVLAVMIHTNAMLHEAVTATNLPKGEETIGVLEETIGISEHLPARVVI